MIATINRKFNDFVEKLAREYNPEEDKYPDFRMIFELDFLANIYPDLSENKYQYALKWFENQEKAIEQDFDNQVEENIADAYGWAETKDYLSRTFGIF